MRTALLIYISTHSQTEMIMVWMRDKGRKSENWGTFIVTQEQTDYSPAALSPMSHDGPSLVPDTQNSNAQLLLTSEHTHTYIKKTLNLRKPVKTWLELRNVAASAAVIQQGGMGIVREKEGKMEGGESVKQELRLIY